MRCLTSGGRCAKGMQVTTLWLGSCHHGVCAALENANLVVKRFDETERSLVLRTT